MMISVDQHTRVYLCSSPVDFRRQIDGLALAVQETLSLDPFCAHLFVFRNRRADKLKAIYWHHNGFILLYKRLEKGCFQWPSTIGAEPVSLSLRELQCLLEGGDIRHLQPVRQLSFSAI